jgi:Ca2+-binding EF-hand superfamily protein
MQDIYTKEEIKTFIDKFSEHDAEGKGEIPTEKLQEVMNAVGKGNKYSAA